MIKQINKINCINKQHKGSNLIKKNKNNIINKNKNNYGFKNNLT